MRIAAAPHWSEITMEHRVPSSTVATPAGLHELWMAESLRVIATVGGSPDFRMERWALVQRARLLRSLCPNARLGRI
jgi:hypothetical protein